MQLITLAGFYAGLGGQIIGVHTSAHYDLVPAIQVWGSYTAKDGPYSLGGTVELSGTAYGATSDVYKINQLFMRLDATVDVVAGTRGTEFRFGVGPALAVRSVHVSGDGIDAKKPFAEPGVRVRTALDAPIGPHVVFQWHIGLTTRTNGADYDTGLGLGWRL